MPLNRFKPSSKIFYWPFQGGTSFVDLLCFCSVLCLLCFVRVCLYVLRGHLLGKGWPLGSRLWCLLWVCHFPIGILGQVWYLIVSIPDLCNLTYYYPKLMNVPSSTFLLCSQLSLKALTIFRRCTGSFEPSLLAYAIGTIISWTGLFHGNAVHQDLESWYNQIMLGLCVHYLGNHELSGPSVCSFMRTARHATIG